MRSSKKLVKILIPSLIGFLILAAGVWLYVSSMTKPLDQSDASSISVEIPSGSSAAVIAQTLEDSGVIASADKFRLWSKSKGWDSQYKAGVYALSPSMDYAQIAAVLVGGKVSMKAFTVPEGLTVEQTIQKLADQGMGEKETFEAVVKDPKWFDTYEFLRYASNEEEMKSNLPDHYLEGYLMPNTYYIAEGCSEEEVIDTMLRQFEKDVYQGIFEKEKDQWADLLTRYGAYLTTENGVQLRDIIKYASIIERETVLDEERPKVAAVIYNRLEKGMKFQMCSTVQYILGKQNKQKDNLTYADLEIDSPYNSYKYNDIPGPICSPGLASIRAAFYPADENYLYFVVSEKLDGSMNFSSDYNQFLTDKAAYDKAYRAAH